MRNDTSRVKVGRQSLRFDTASGFDTGVVYPRAGITHLNISQKGYATFWTFAENPHANGFQGAQPVLVLYSSRGSVTLTPTASAMTSGIWQQWTVPLSGSAAWSRKDSGTPNLLDINRVEIHQDTWDFGFTEWFDGLTFAGTPTPSPPPPPPSPSPPPPPPPPQQDHITPKVMAVLYDPILHSLNNERLHQLNGTDPMVFLPGAVQKFHDYSHGVVDYQIVETDVLDAWPYLTDGFQYNEQTFLRDYNAHTPHQGGQFDYNRMFADLGIAQKVSSGAVDEVWLFTGNTDYFKTWESTMAGPGAYWVNSPPVQNVQSTRAFITMGFNFERLALGEVGHGFGHRVESIMTHIYGVWDQNNPNTNNWAKFTMLDKNSPGQGGVGNIHYPVNGLTDYDYGNTRTVVSNAPDWANYATGFKGTTMLVSSATWAKPGEDPQYGYLDWWNSWLPHFTGRNADGKLNDWWVYITDVNHPA